jgi:hypothetical protein
MRPVFVALSIAAAPLGFVLGEAALLVLFFGVFFPIGLSMRIVRRDPLEKQFERDAASYWRSLDPPSDAASYYRQF